MFFRAPCPLCLKTFYPAQPWSKELLLQEREDTVLLSHWWASHTWSFMPREATECGEFSNQGNCPPVSS